MSAELLRRASQRMCDDYYADGDPFILAVADWLDATANRIDNSRNHGWRGTKHAVTVARTYLGES